MDSMATYRIQAPNGRTYSIDGPEGATQEEVIAQIIARDPSAAIPARPQPEAGFLGSMVGTGQQLLSASRTGIAALTGDAPEAIAEGEQRAQDIARRTGEMASFDRLAQRYQEDGAAGAARQVVADIPSLAGQALPSTGAALAGGFAGARAGAMVGGPAGAVVGGVLGSVAANWLPQFGANLMAQAEAQRERGEEVDPDLIKAALAATGQSALEAGGAAITLGRNMVARILGRATSRSQSDKALVEAAQRSLAGTVARGAGRGTVTELPVEVAQDVIERYQAGLDLTSDEAYESYANAAYAGMGGGATVGAGASPFNRSAAREELIQRGIDPETGQRVATPEADQEREAALRAEQIDVETGRAAREAARAAREDELDAYNAERRAAIQSYRAPLNLERVDAEIQAELNQLYSTGVESPELTRRINALESELERREALRELPEDEDARRAQVSERELRRQPPASRARDSARALLRGQLADVDTAVLTVERDSLRDQYDSLSEDQKVYYQALNAEVRDRERIQRARVKELREQRRLQEQDAQRRAEENEAARQSLPPTLRADIIGESNLPPIFTPEVLRDSGLPRNAKFTKQLQGLDLTDPEQRRQAVQVINEALENKRVAEATREKLRALIQRPQFQGIDFTSPPPASTPAAPEALTPATAPIAPLSPEIFDALGIGRTAKMRKDNTVLSLDPADPEQRARLAEILEDYANDRLRSAAMSDRIMDYVDRLRAPQQGERDATAQPTGPESVGELGQGPDNTGVDVAGLRSEPSVGEPAPGAAGATQLELPGLDDTGSSPQQTDAVGSGPDSALSPETIQQNSNDVVQVTSQAYENNGNAGDLAGSVTPEFVEAVNSGDLRGALAIIRDNAREGFNSLEAWLAGRFLQDEGTLPNIEIVDSLPPRDGRPVLGQYNAVTDTIQLVRGQADSHTLLHELTHAYTHRYLVRQQKDNYSDPHAKALLDIYAHVRRMMPDAQEYGLTNLSEFVAEAMSNPSFQMRLMGIPYRKQTIWSKFVEGLRNVLGMPATNPVDNTLFAAIVHVDGLMNPGRQMQVDETGTRVVNPVVAVIRGQLTPPGQLTPEDYWAIEQSPNQQQRTALKVFLTNFQRSAHEPSVATKLRVKAVDQFASVAERLQSQYENGIYNAFGELNPINFLRQAVDYKRVALQVFRRGGLRKEPNGYYAAYDLTDAEGNPINPAMALEEIKALGERMGEDYAGAKARVSRVLEGMRLQELREFNDQKERLAQAYEALNTPEADKLADEARSGKIRLHMLNSEIDELVRIYESSPEIQRVQEVLRATRENLIENMVVSGRLTEEAGEFWRSNIHYVPFNRMEEVLATTDLTEFRGRRGIAQLGALPKLRGSYVRPVANTIDNYMNTLSWMVGQVMRNDGTVRVLQAMERAGYARRVESAAQAGNTKLLSPVVYIEGEPVRYELQSEADLAAFAQADSPDGSVINALAFTSRLLRGTITAMPTFSLNQNMQDTIRAGVQSGTKSSLSTAGRTLLNFPMNVARSFISRESVDSQTLHNFGVVGNYDYNPVDPLSTLEHETGAIKQGVVGRTLRRLEQIAKASDQAAREAVYQQTMLETQDQALAITRARELINYNRRGASRVAQVLSKTVPFFNAYVQGLDLMYRGFTGRDSPSGLGRKESRNYILSRVAMMMGLGFAYAAFMSDDEDYKNANDYVRDRGWIIPHAISSMFDSADGRHTPLVIPTPREFAFFIKMIPERIVQFHNDTQRGEDQLAWDVVKDILGAAADTFVMAPMPPGIRQAIEYSTNHSHFTGRPLVGEHLQDAPAHLQVSRDTSELARALGRTFNLSPIKIDNLLQGTFGTAGALALRVLDQMANENAPELPMDKIPGLSTFTAAQAGNRNTTEFYDLRDKINRAVAGARLLEDSPAERHQFMQEYGHYVGLQQWAKQKEDAMRELRKMRDLIMRSDKINMTAKERRQELLKLDKIEQKLMSDVPRTRGGVERARAAARQ